jgi:hypothetical protein
MVREEGEKRERRGREEGEKGEKSEKREREREREKEKKKRNGLPCFEYGITPILFSLSRSFLLSISQCMGWV